MAHSGQARRKLVETLRHPQQRTHRIAQRTVAEILDMIRTLGALVGAQDRAAAPANQLAANIEDARQRAARAGNRPKVYFEEWDDPMISGIAWVSELIDAAGGADIVPELAPCKSARDRIVTCDPVIRRAPDIIIGSWCGKKFKKDKVVARPRFETIPAVSRGRLHEIKSPLILQPGPAALTDGLVALEAIICGSI